MKNETIYVTPVMKILNIELEQPILQCSVENLGNEHDEMGWD